MAFSGSLTSSLALQPPAGRSRQLQIPARTSRQGLSSTHTTAARVEEVLFKRPDVPADWSDSDAKQQRRFASASQQTSGKVAAHPRSALEQASFATNQTLTQRMEEKPQHWGISLSGLTDQIQQLSKISLELSRAAATRNADLSKTTPANA